VMATAGFALLHQGLLTNLAGLAILLAMVFATRNAANSRAAPRPH